MYLGQLQSRSIANQPQSQWYQSQECSVVSDTFYCRDLSKHHYLITAYSGHGVNQGYTQAGWAIADQPRTNGGFHRHFLKIEMIWFMRIWNLLFWFFFVIGYHYWTQIPGKPECKSKNNLSCESLASPLAIVDSHITYNKCLSQLRTNRRSIAMQDFTIACPFIILRHVLKLHLRSAPIYIWWKPSRLFILELWAAAAKPPIFWWRFWGMYSNTMP